MNDRLIKLMQFYNFSSSVFADEIGVIRSSVSHIISGRNKPGVDLVQKVLKRFPEVSSDWLLLGVGSMLKDNKSANQLHNPDSNTGGNKMQAVQAELPINFEMKGSGVESKLDKHGESHTQDNDLTEVRIPAGTAKPIKRITVYFGDGSFQDFIAD